MENRHCDFYKFCDSCNFCNFCDSCNSCNFCNFCASCINLKMTEYNYFCYSDKHNSNTSFQQKRYRIFNKEISEEEYFDIDKVRMKLEFDINEKQETRYKTAFKTAFEKLSQEDKDKIINLPGFNEEDFLEYYGVDLDNIIEVNGKQYKLIV